MAGRRPRRKRSPHSSSQTVNKRRVSARLAERNWEFDLPTELLELIFSFLSAEDITRASAVCTKWQAAAAAVQKFNNPPWLLFYAPTFEFCDLSRGRRHHACKLFGGDRVCYARGKWILSYHSFNGRLTLFCPYTKEKIQFPRLQYPFLGAAFSAPPTSPNSVVFTIHYTTPTHVDIGTCRPGDVAWTMARYESEHPFLHCIWNCVVLRNGHFYCMSKSGWIGVYDPQTSTWRVLDVPPLYCFQKISYGAWKHQFMAEHDGNIFLVRTTLLVRPKVYILDLINNKWMKVDDLGGATFFTNATTSCIRNEMPGSMRDCICFSKVLDDCRNCVRYSLRRKRFYADNQGFLLFQLQPYENVWLDEPS